MLPGRVSNPGPLTYESGALPIALPGPAGNDVVLMLFIDIIYKPVAYIVELRLCQDIYFPYFCNIVVEFMQ